MPIHILSVNTPKHGTFWGCEYSQEFTLPGKVHRLNGFSACVTCGSDVWLSRHLEGNQKLSKTDFEHGDKMGLSVVNVHGGQYAPKEYNDESLPTRTNILLSSQPISTLVGSYSITLSGSGILCADMPALALGHRSLCPTLAQNIKWLDTPVSVTSGTPIRLSFSEREVSPFLSPDEYVPKDYERTDHDKQHNIIPLIWQYWGDVKGDRPSMDYQLKIYLDYD